MMAAISWKVRQFFWSGWQVLRFRAAKERRIEQPPPLERTIGLVPFAKLEPSIPLKHVRTFDQLPKSESNAPLRIATGLGLFLAKRYSPMQPGVGEIDADIDRALDQHLTVRYRKTFENAGIEAPRRPAAFDGADPNPDLAELAVKGPYALLLNRDDAGALQWDLRHLGEYEHHDGLCNLGLRVQFAEGPGGLLEVIEIDSTALGVVRPGDTGWAAVTRLAVCAATTHTCLIRHFNFVHLIAANHWDIVTRNSLATEHPLFRLVWPHIANSLYTNYGITRAQLLPNGEFVDIFSFTHDGLMALYDDTYRSYDIRVTDPELDWTRRGLDGATFSHPSHDNLLDVFQVMHDHARRYVHAYYPDDQALRRDKPAMLWLDQLEAAIPNGIESVLGPQRTRDGLARLIGGFIYEGNTIHDLVGTSLWDYQLWADHNPTRVYRDGSRVRVDVFQRMINSNYGLQLKRAALLADDGYGYLALQDGHGPELFARFLEDAKALQASYDQHKDARPWRMEPKILEMNMNG